MITNICHLRKRLLLGKFQNSVIKCLVICCTILCGCHRNIAPEENKPTSFVAKRIMVVVMPSQEFVYSWDGFLSVCDTVFKNSGIAKTAVVLNKEELANAKDEEAYLWKTLKNPIEKFLPDCLLFISPGKRSSTFRANFLEYRVSLMPIDITAFLLPKLSNDEDVSMSPQSVGFFTLISTGMNKDDRKMGIKSANKFMPILLTTPKIFK